VRASSQNPARKDRRGHFLFPRTRPGISQSRIPGNYLQRHCPRLQKDADNARSVLHACREEQNQTRAARRRPQTSFHSVEERCQVKTRHQCAPLAKVDHNDVLEDEVREICGDLSAKERLEVAEKFARWADQLFESAAQMNPDLAKSYSAPVPKVPRGFFLVNLAKWQENDLRKLARDCGVELRGALGWAITTVKINLRERVKLAKLLGVHPNECWRLTETNEKN